MNEKTQTLNQALLAAMDSYANRDCFRVKRGRYYHPVSYDYFRTLVFRLADFMQRQGVSQGERVAIAAHKSVEWMVAHIACLFSGGVSVPVRPFLPADQLRFRVQDSGACLVVAQDSDQLRTLEKDQGLSGVETILVIDETNQDSDPTGRALSSILGQALTPTQETAVRRTAANIRPEAFAAIYYSVDGMAEPHGAVFDQGQCLTALQLMAEWFILDEDDFAFTTPLPWSYVPNLYASLHYFLSGVGNALIQSEETSFEDLQQISPTVTLTNPNAIEYIYHRVVEEMSQLPEASREVFDWALAIGKEYRAAGPAASKELREGYARADLTFFSQIRGRMGGRFQRFYSAGAPLPVEGVEFAETIGLQPLDIYFKTEAGGFPAITRLQGRRAGSCGQVAPGFQVRIAEDGEVLLRSRTMMREYWRRPEETQQAVDAEGWLHTGDLGYLDEDQYLYLTGHKLAPMVLSTGRKIIPTTVEDALTASVFIDQAIIFGEGRSYMSALIVPDLEALSRYFQEVEDEDEASTLADPASISPKWFWPHDDEDREPMVTMAHPKVKILLDKVIGAINDQRDGWERIEQYCLFDQARSKAANDLVELMTTGRQRVQERYASLIETMYPTGPQTDDKRVTQVQVSPERMRDLLEKENILDAWMADAGIQFLFDLANTKQIDAPCMVHVCDTAATIAQMESEEKPLSTALIIGDPARIAHVLPPSQIQLLRHDHIRRMRKILVTMAKMVDGLVLGYVVDTYGYVRGVHRLSTIEMPKESNSFFGPQFYRHAVISEQCEAIVFYVPAGGRQVRVFANGQMVGRYANGDWSPDNILAVEGIMSRLTKDRGYDAALAQRILRCAFQMSEENLGAIFLLGQANLILERSDISEIGAFAAIVSGDIATLTDAELINFAKQDGATVVDVQGQFRGCMVLLRPAADTSAEIGPGKGARHSSAAKMSAEAQCLAITVSQDGPVTIYDSGRRLLSL